MALCLTSYLIISAVFSKPGQTVLDILNELPVEKEGKLQTPSDFLDFSGVKVDDEGNAGG